MTHERLAAIKERIVRILDLGDLSDEPEAKADLACLACILTSALIEVACRLYVSRYVERRAESSVHSYVCAKLYFFQNAKSKEIDDLLRGFSPQLAERFALKIGDRGKDAIDSVVNKKNELVHGKGAGIGLDSMKRYHKDVLGAVDALRELLATP